MTVYLLATLLLSLGHSARMRDTTLPDTVCRMGKRFIVDASDDGKERQFPFAHKFGNNIFISCSEHYDSVLASPIDALVISRDNGRTWTEKIRHHDFYLTSMFRKGGILYGIVYYTYPADSGRERMIYWTSANEGRTWTRHEGSVQAPPGKPFPAVRGVWGSMLFHRGMKLMKDGSIQGVMYGHLGAEKKYTVAWVKSTDNCASWQIVSIIASGVPSDRFSRAEGYCEPAFAFTRDRSLLCVMRIGSYLPLFQARSYDQGLTWTRPVQLPGLPDTASQSVCPDLLLMKNGVLALSYGRPGDRIAFSTDGCGYHWDKSLDLYTGETTGYTGIVETKPGTLLLVADQGRTGAREKAIWGGLLQVNLKAAPLPKTTIEY